MKRDTFVYRAYNADGELLYIGITNAPDRRRREHRSDAIWEQEIHRVRMSGPYPRPVAAEIERRGLAVEEPLHGDTPARRSARGRATASDRRHLRALIEEGMEPLSAARAVLAEKSAS